LSTLCLAGEGDAIRRLESITKSRLKHIQYDLDDFVYKITNLARDLRDGVRLTRLIEIFSNRDDCSQLLRYPAVVATQRQHNLSIAFSAIQSAGVPLMLDGESVNTVDIEIGNREKTLFLLWRLISHFKLPRYLKEVNLNEEIVFLKKLLFVRGLDPLNIRVCQKRLIELIVFRL